MKIACPIFLISFLVLIFSCNEKKEPVASTKDDTKDSTISINPETSINRYAPVDISPMDMSYFPTDYPKFKMGNDKIEAPVARVIYSRPHLQGRHLFNELLKYEEPWRLGANEATEIEFYRDVTILGKKMKRGRYVMYCIPHTASWTIVLNDNVDSWGLQQDRSKDIQTFDIPSVHEHGGPSLEYFTIVFEKSAAGADILFAWGDIMARLPIQFD